MKLQYEYELENNLTSGKLFFAIFLVLMLLMSAFLVTCAIYEIERTGKIFGDNTEDGGPFDMFIIAFVMVGVAISFLFSNRILKAKHKRLKNKGVRAQGYITYADCSCDIGYAICKLKISVYDVPFEIKGVAENDAFNYIYSYRHLLKYTRIPVTVYLYDTKMYADLSSVDINKFYELVNTRQNIGQNTYAVYRGLETHENNNLE